MDNRDAPTQEGDGSARAVDVRRRAATPWSLPVRGRHRWLPEWYVVNQWHVRVIALILALVQIVAVKMWVDRSWQLWSGDDTICSGRCEETWFKSTQAVLAVVGITLALVLVVYLIRVALVDRTWRHRRRIAIVFGSVAAIWSGLVIAVVKEWP